MVEIAGNASWDKLYYKIGLCGLDWVHMAFWSALEHLCSFLFLVAIEHLARRIVPQQTRKSSFGRLPLLSFYPVIR